MDDDAIIWRRCEVKGCGYKERRGSREGHFVDGKFVCPSHYVILAMPLFGEDEGSAAAAKALFENRPDAAWEPPAIST